MAKIRITGKLTGTLSEAYYKEFCDQHGWAYISLEQIHERGEIKKDILKFKKGFRRTYVKIPKEIIPEIKEISKPSNAKIFEPSYVYDFLACRIDKGDKIDAIVTKQKEDFCWIEVKTGYEDLTENQVQILKKITIPLYRFRVPTPLVEAREVYIYWDEVTPVYLMVHNLG